MPVLSYSSVLPTRIRSLRLRLRMTQMALAAKMGVKQPQLSAWEKGLHTPNIVTLRKLARALKTTVDGLTEGV